MTTVFPDFFEYWKRTLEVLPQRGRRFLRNRARRSDGRYLLPYKPEEIVRQGFVSYLLESAHFGNAGGHKTKGVRGIFRFYEVALEDRIPLPVGISIVKYDDPAPGYRSKNLLTVSCGRKSSLEMSTYTLVWRDGDRLLFRHKGGLRKNPNGSQRRILCRGVCPTVPGRTLNLRRSAVEVREPSDRRDRRACGHRCITV